MVNNTEKTVLQGNTNQEELFSINTEQNDIHFPENTYEIPKYPKICAPKPTLLLTYILSSSLEQDLPAL